MPKQRALVTGGSGFLGFHLVSQLLESGRYEVTVLDIRPCAVPGATSVVADLRKLEEVVAAAHGMDIVFHCATAAPSSEGSLNKELMQAVNVNGTANVIQACIQNRISKLVFTSSSSVVFDGKPLRFVNEQHPYAAKPMDYYTQTKIEAEKLVLAANGRDGLQILALRPSSIFGEHDPIYLPSVIKRAKAGKLKYMVGSNKALCDWTYVGNVAQAHIDAADALSGPRAQQVAGRAFFITNQQPRPFWDFTGDMCEGLGYARPHIKLPVLLCLIIAMIFQYFIRPLLLPIVKLNADLTVNRIMLITTDRTFDSQQSREVLGYKPKVPLAEAMRRTIAHFKEKEESSEAAAKPKAA